MSSLATPLDEIQAGIEQVTGEDGLRDGLGALGLYLGLLPYEKGRGTVVSDSDGPKISDIGLRLLEKSMVFHPEVDEDFTNEVLNEMVRAGQLPQLINKLGDSTYPKGIQQAGKAGRRFFSVLENYATEDELRAGGAAPGMENILAAHVEGLEDFCRHGDVEYYVDMTLGVDKFGAFMTPETQARLAELAPVDAGRIKSMAMAAILEHFQPDEIATGLDVEYPLEHPELLVENLEGFPMLDDYRQWIRDGDLDALIDEMYASALNTGRVMVLYARPEDKAEVAKNYIFAIGLVHKLEELELVGPNARHGYYSRTNWRRIQKDTARFKEVLPEGTPYPEDTQAAALAAPEVGEPA